MTSPLLIVGGGPFEASVLKEVLFWLALLVAEGNPCTGQSRDDHCFSKKSKNQQRKA